MKANQNDSVSQRFSKVAHCWEFKKCGQALCPVYLNDSSTNCYYISGTPGAGGALQSVASKIEGCKKCDFYQYSEKHSLEFRERMMKNLKSLEDEFQSIFKVSLEEKTAIFKQRAERLRKRLSREELEEKVRVLTFCLGNEKYCIRVKQALEIINATDINRLPCTPQHFAGVINLRGNILTLVDLNQFLGIEKDSPNASKTIIVIEVAGEITGIVVDKVEDILDVAIKQIAPPLTTLKGIKEEFTEGEVLIEGKSFTLLNLERMMMNERMKVFEMVNPKV